VPLTQGVVQLHNLPVLTSLVRSVLLPTALANPYSTSGSIVGLGGAHPAYGVKWSMQTAPSSAGRSSRSVVVFQENYLSLSLHYTFADASDFVGDSILTGAAEGFLLFELGQPSRLDYDILAGWTVNFAWLIAP
jgi:hypothetical protein